MITSNQISGLMSNQMSQYAAMQQQSAQISGQIGMPMPPMQSPGFSYGNLADPWGTQSSARTGIAGMSAVNTATNVGMAGLGLAGGFSLLGGAGAAFDPFTAALTGFSKGSGGLSAITGAGSFSAGAGRVAGGLAMGSFAMLPALALQQAVSFAGKNMVAGAQEDYAIQQSLMRNANFYNPNARSGRGFSTGQRDEISDMVRSIGEQDPFSSIGETNRILERAMSGNLMQGVSSAKEFSSKFKKLTDTLRETAKLLSTSMEGAMEFFDASQRMGFYSKADILRNAQNALTMSGGGLSAKGIMQEQAAGSAMARAQGFTGAQGAILARSSIMNVRDMFMSGSLSQENLMEMSGGLRGEQAYASIGRQMQQASYRLAQAPVGRAITAALAEVKDGKFTGRVDAGLMRQFRSGQLSAGDVRRLAENKVGSAGQETKLSFLNMRDDITGAFAASAGAEGWMGVMSMIKADRPGTSDEAVKLLMRRMTGMGRRQVEYIMKLYERMDLMNQQRATRAADLLRKQAEKVEMAQNYTLGGLWRQFTHSVSSVTSMPLKRAGVSMGRWFRDLGDKARVWSFGDQRTAELDTRGQELLMASAMGDQATLAMGAGASSNTAIADAMKGTTDLSTGWLNRVRGRTAGDRIIKGMGLNVLRGLEGEGPQVRLSRSLGPVDQNDLRPAALDVSQSKLEAASSLINLMATNGENFFRDHKGAVDSVKAGIKSISEGQLFEINEMEAKGDSSAHRRRISMIASTVKSRLSGAQYDSVREKAAMHIHGKSFKDLNEDQKRSVSVIADQGLITEASRQLGGPYKKLLDTGEEFTGGTGDLALSLDARKLGGARDAQYKTLAKSLASAVSPWVAVGAGAAVGAAALGGAGLAGGGIMALPGAIVGAIGGGLGALGGYFLGKGTKVSADEIMSNLKDEGTRDQMLMMMREGEAGDKARQEYLGGKDKSSFLYRYAKRIGQMSPEERKALAKGSLRTLDIINLGQALNVASKGFRRGGRELLGLDRGELAEAGGEDIATLLLGEKGDGGLAKLAMGMGGKGQTIGQQQLTYNQIQAQMLSAAEQLADVKGGKLSALRKTLGGTAMGQKILAMRTVFADKKIEKSLEGVLDDETALASPDKMQARLRSLGFDVQKGHMETVMKAAKSQDVTQLQKALALSVSTPQKENATSILTSLRDGITDMSKTTKGLLDVLITVHEEKLNKSGNRKAATLRKQYNVGLDPQKANEAKGT